MQLILQWKPEALNGIHIFSWAGRSFRQESSFQFWYSSRPGSVRGSGMTQLMAICVCSKFRLFNLLAINTRGMSLGTCSFKFRFLPCVSIVASSSASFWTSGRVEQQLPASKMASPSQEPKDYHSQPSNTAAYTDTYGCSSRQLGRLWRCGPRRCSRAGGCGCVRCSTCSCDRVGHTAAARLA